MIFTPIFAASFWRSPGFGAVQGEGPRVGEAVEHAASLGKLGDSSAIVLLIEEKSRFLTFFNVDKMKFGNNVSVHPMCYFQASGGIEIGNDVSIAHGVTLMTQNHSYEDRNIPIKDQPVISKPIIIEDNVWIGAKATVLYGRRIGKNSVIAAGAVVTKDVPPNTVVAGVPARVIKEFT